MSPRALGGWALCLLLLLLLSSLATCQVRVVSSQTRCGSVPYRPLTRCRHPPAPACPRRVFLSLLQDQVVDTEELEAKAVRLRASLAADPGSFMKLLKLAAVLQQLDYAAPDGGKRVPEAEALYR